MVDATSNVLLVETGAPLWAQRFAHRVRQHFLGLFPSAPVRLWKVAEADLPDPAAWLGSQVWVTDLGKPAWSNGTAWVDATGAPV